MTLSHARFYETLRHKGGDVGIVGRARHSDTPSIARHSHGSFHTALKMVRKSIDMTLVTNCSVTDIASLKLACKLYII